MNRIVAVINFNGKNASEYYENGLKLSALDREPKQVKRMTVPLRPPQADESYDENEAKHRFDAALRSARRAHEQRLSGAALRDEKQYAVSAHRRSGKDRP